MTQRPATQVDAFCTGKDKFKSATIARTVASRMAGRHAERMSAYMCPTCHHWHVGQRLSRREFKA